MSLVPGFRGKYLLPMWVEDLSNLARSKSCALPVRPLDCVRAVLATAENITKQATKTRLTDRLRLRIFRVPLTRGPSYSCVGSFCFLRTLSQTKSDNVKTKPNRSEIKLKLN